MKFITSFLLLFSINTCSAQVEMFIKWTDGFSLDGEKNIVDQNENTYILTTLYCFDTLNGVSFYCGDLGNAIVKIDKYNNIIWRKYYNNANSSIFQLSARQFLLNNKYILIPYSKDFGIQDCYKDSNGVSYGQELSINSIIAIDSNTGDTVKNSTFNNRKLCGLEIIQKCFTDKSKIINIVYSNDSANYGYNQNRFHVQTVDSLFNLIRDTSFYPLNDKLHGTPTKLIFDSTNNHYLVTDNIGIYVYDSSFVLLNFFDFRNYNVNYSNITNNTVSYNENYYTSNFTVYDNYSKKKSPYTIVITKEGKLISSIPSVIFNELLITHENNIIGISSWGSQDSAALFDTVQHPLTLIEMSISQKIKRKVSFGKTGIIANSISLTQDNNVIVTGTYFISKRSLNTPLPDEIYYYKQNRDSIALVDENNDCRDIQIYPNPSSGIIDIINNTNYHELNSNLEIYNISGRKLFSELITNTNIASVDLTKFPTGLYVFKYGNSDLSCISKIFKQ